MKVKYEQVGVGVKESYEMQKESLYNNKQANNQTICYCT